MTADDVLDRSRELERLEAAFDEANKGDGRLLVIEGPAGIGKTALLKVARERARINSLQTQNAGGKALRAALSGPAALTPSERRVAELAASGLSNREIAETLWVTQKTVEVHLSHTYAKLGIRTRAQLAEALEPTASAA